MDTLASNNQGPLNPATILETLNAYKRSASLRGAIELDIFSAIARGCTRVDELATACQASPRGVRILCDYLVAIGFLTKQSDQYGLTPTTAAFLDRQSPQYMGNIASFVQSDDMMDAFRDVAMLVRKGTTLLNRDGTTETNYRGWVEFARNMAAVMVQPAEFIGQLSAASDHQPLRVLDIAAGHGLFGISVARHNPNATIAALDWEDVLRVAQENAKAANVHDRLTLLPGNAFEVDFGNGFDLVLVTNFFHHFTTSENEMVMRKIYNCLNPNGRAITLEFIPNEDRVSPPMVATFSMTMLGTTPAGDAYTFSEYERMFRNAGFDRNDLIAVPNSQQHVIVSCR